MRNPVVYIGGTTRAAHPPPDAMPKHTAMPPLGFKGVRWYRRSLESGATRYAVVFTRKGKSPVRKWITLTSSLEGPAQAEALSMARRWHLGTFDPWKERAERLSVREAARRWMASGKDWTPATVRGRRGVLRLFTGDYGRRDLAAITQSDIEAFVTRAGLAPASQASYLRVLRTFLRFCQAKGYLDEDPSAGVRLTRGSRARKKIAHFTERDLDRFCEAAYAYYDRRADTIDKARRGNVVWIVPLVRFATATGLRKGELRNLRWEDLDEAHTRLRVRSRAGFTPKQGSSRVVPVFPMARDVLATQWARRRSDTRRSEIGLVFPGPTGKMLGESQINRAFRIVRAEAGLPDTLTFHSTRHTFASWLLTEGESLYKVSQWLGHQDIKTTANIYGHLVRHASDIAERVFS